LKTSSSGSQATLHHQDQGEEGEDPGGDADDRAAGDLARFLATSVFGELDSSRTSRRSLR